MCLVAAYCILYIVYVASGDFPVTLLGLCFWTPLDPMPLPRNPGDATGSVRNLTRAIGY